LIDLVEIPDSKIEDKPKEEKEKKESKEETKK